MTQARVGRKRAVQALMRSGGDVEGAVLDMPHTVEKET